MAPVANFTFAPSPALSTVPVQFTDTSTGSPTAWEWTLTHSGTGQVFTSALQNPSFTLPVGRYEAKLKVTNADGEDTKTIPPFPNGPWVTSGR